MLDMAQNSRFSDEIDREATKMQADAHLQNDLPGKGIPLKTTQIFLTIFWELYSVVLKPIWRVEISSVKIFLSYLSARYASCSTRPIKPIFRRLFYIPLSMHMEGFQQRWFKVKYNNLAQQEYFIIGLLCMMLPYCIILFLHTRII